MLYSMWLRAVLPRWTGIVPRRLPTNSIATTCCRDTEVSLMLKLGVLTCTCSMKFKTWESGSACTPGNVPETSSFLGKVKQIWLPDDNHMHRAVQAQWMEWRRTDVKRCCLTQSSHSCERVMETTFVFCAQFRRAKKLSLGTRRILGQWQTTGEERTIYVIWILSLFMLWLQRDW